MINNQVNHFLIKTYATNIQRKTYFSGEILTYFFNFYP